MNGSCPWSLKGLNRVQLPNNSMNIFKYDVAEKYQMGFQDPSSPAMEEIINFHNYVMIYVAFILIGVTTMGFLILQHYSKSNKTVIAHKFLVHGTTIEFI